MLAGLIGGIALWIAATARYDDAVRSLARAPVGCDTTLDFAEPGQYLIFVETRGEVPAVRGDCEVEGRFDLAGERAPTTEVSMVDPDGNEVELLSRRGRESYDRAGSAGESLARVTIESAGDHVVRVETASDSSYAIAIGRDPADGVSTLRLLGVVVAIVGIAAGVVLLVTGRRRAAPSTPPPAAPGLGSSGWGAAPAAGPPPMHTPRGPPPAPAPPPGPWTAPGAPQSPPPPATGWQTGPTPTVGEQAMPSAPEWQTGPTPAAPGQSPPPPATGWQAQPAPTVPEPAPPPAPPPAAPEWQTGQEPSPWDTAASPEVAAPDDGDGSRPADPQIPPPS